MPKTREMPATEVTEGMMIQLENTVFAKVKVARRTKAVRVSHEEYPDAFAVDIEYTSGGWTFAHPKQIVTVLA